MKHRSVVIALLLIVSIIVSCSDNRAVQYRYKLEQLSFEIDRTTRDFQLKPELRSKESITVLGNNITKLVQACYEALESVSAEDFPDEYRQIEQITFQSITKSTQYYFAAGNYNNCITGIEELMARIRLPKVELMSAYYNLGRALQANGNWDSCQAIYDIAAVNFYPPTDQQGEIIIHVFNMPLHLYTVSKRIGDDAIAAKRFTFANEYYEKIANDFPNTKLSITSGANLARLFEMDNQYTEAISYIEKMVDSTGEIYQAAQLRIAGILNRGLKKYDKALAAYNSVESNLAAKDSLVLASIMIDKARIYFKQNKYRDSRQMLIELDRQFPRIMKSIPSAQHLKGQTFEMEGNWDRAETEYRFLIDNFGASNEAMAIFLHIAKHYKDKNRPQTAEIWYNKASSHYDLIATQATGTIKEAAALSYKAELYRIKRDWETAALTLEEIFNRFTRSEVGQRANIAAARIYTLELDNKLKADSLLASLRASMNEIR